MKVKHLYNILDRGMFNATKIKEYEDFENYEVLINGEKVVIYGVGYTDDPKVLSFNLESKNSDNKRQNTCD